MEPISTGSLTETQKEDLLNQFKQQIVMANVQELINKMVEKCFKKCISKPGTSLDGSEQKCVAMCMDRFLDSYSLVTKTYTNRLQRENQKM